MVMIYYTVKPTDGQTTN